MARRMTGRAWPGVVGLLGLTLALVLFAGAPAWGPLLLVAFATVYAAGLWRWSRARIRAVRYRPPGSADDDVPSLLLSVNRVLSEDEAREVRRVWQQNTATGTIRVLDPDTPVTSAHLTTGGEQWRDPAWPNAINELSEQRRRLAARLAVLQARVKELRITLRNTRTANGDLRAELDSLLVELDGQRAVMLQAGRHAGIRSVQDWIAVPREDVVDLPRAVRAACDCRYGHWDFHPITGSEGSRVFRECAVCEPPTRWAETGATP
jgi:hypothetical protein